VRGARSNRFHVFNLKRLVRCRDIIGAEEYRIGDIDIRDPVTLGSADLNITETACESFDGGRHPGSYSEDFLQFAILIVFLRC
jgi:hypothetical protein